MVEYKSHLRYNFGKMYDEKSRQSQSLKHMQEKEMKLWS